MMRTCTKRGAVLAWTISSRYARARDRRRALGATPAPYFHSRLWYLGGDCKPCDFGSPPEPFKFVGAPAAFASLPAASCAPFSSAVRFNAHECDSLWPRRLLASTQFGQTYKDRKL